jgi:outer membrane biosynthesis protein TonB
LSGEVVLGWNVNADGKADSVDVVRSSLGSPDAEQCMARQVAAWEFPHPKNIARVQFAFIFKAPN